MLSKIIQASLQDAISSLFAHPALKRRAIFVRPFGAWSSCVLSPTAYAVDWFLRCCGIASFTLAGGLSCVGSTLRTETAGSPGLLGAAVPTFFVVDADGSFL